jgi:EAL domain-containing protein (putative c-di-GMP-specific phosphodiesterase class I)
MKVIAEGVETQEQQQFLRAEGCDEIQGFLSGRPMPPDELVQRLRSRPASD